jgi:hypothetical protein
MTALIAANPDVAGWFDQSAVKSRCEGRALLHRAQMPVLVLDLDLRRW